MRKDVSGDQSSKNPKNDEKRLSGGGEGKLKKSEKMMKKDVSGGQKSKNLKK
jgi:hypothetical protein